MEVLKVASMALAFLLELCALAAIGYWGFQTGQTTLVRLVLGLGLPLLIAILWGIFLSPKASMPVPEPWRTIVRQSIFALAVVLLYLSGQTVLAGIFALALVINLISLTVWKQ